MLKACQAPWCTAHRYSSFPAKSHIIPVSLPNVHSLLAAELGSKSSDRGARVNIHIYRAEGSFHLPFERMQHFIRMNFRTLGRRTSLLSGANINRAQRQTHLGGQRERRKLECFIAELWVVVLLFCALPRKSPSSLKAHILTFQQFEYHCFWKVAPFDEFLLHKVD